MQVRRALIATVASLAFANMASGAIITLSSASSEPGIDPSDLSATLEFTVTGNTLTLTVTNNTPSPTDPYNINMVFFNAGGNVTGLTLINEPPGASAWELVTTGFPETHAAGFGIFDFLIKHDPPFPPGHQSHLIQPGLARVFTFTILGTGPFFDTDFTTKVSQPFDGNLLMIAAGKFIQGPGDASAFGAVPEPGTLALLGLAGAMLAMRRRRPA